MNTLFNFVGLLASSSSAAGDSANANTSSMWVYVILIVLVVLMLVLPMITQRKRNKEYAEMLGSLNVGDTVKTIGGIIGRVTKITEKDGAKTFILETGAKNAKTTMEFDIASVAYIMNQTKAPTVEVKEELRAEEPVQEEIEEAEVDPQEKTEEAQTKAPAKKTTTKKATTKKTTKK